MADSSQSEGKLKGSRKVGLDAWHRAVACSEFGIMSTGKDPAAAWYEYGEKT